MSKRYSLLSTEIYGKPWLITVDAYRLVCDIANRLGDPESVLAKRGERPEEAQSMEIRDGVAIIHVRGPIIRYASLFSRISGVCSVDDLSVDLTLAQEDSTVRGIVIHFDSPGGQATGINELSARIFEARANKPVVAYVGGQAASAAYWLASACSEVVIDSTAMLGSVGVVFRLENPDAEEPAIEIVSKRSPKKRPDITSAEGQAQIRTWADDICDVFIASVARFRGVSEEKVETDFGQGDILVGEKAVAAGMADKTGNLEAVIAGLSRRQSHTGVFIMSDTNTSPAASQEQAPPTLTAALVEEKHPEIAAHFRKDGAAAELKRINGVLALDKTNKTELAATIHKLALDGATTPETAAYKLMTEQGEAATKAAADLAADAAQIPVVDSGSGEGDAAVADEKKAIVSNIVAGAGR